jgi:hypothetical protein
MLKNFTGLALLFLTQDGSVNHLCSSGSGLFTAPNGGLVTAAASAEEIGEALKQLKEAFDHYSPNG